jgi:hypothetical protein
MNVDPGQVRAELQAVEDAAAQVVAAVNAARRQLDDAEAADAAAEAEAEQVEPAAEAEVADPAAEVEPETPVDGEA